MTPASPRQLSQSGLESAAAKRLAGFFRVLRDNGFTSGIAESLDASRMLTAISPSDLNFVRESWKALVSGNAEQWRRFDLLFDAYWLGKGQKRPGVAFGGAGTDRPPSKERSPTTIGRPGLPAMLDRGDTGEAAAGGEGKGASSAESLVEVDLRHIADAEELRQAHVIAADLARRMKRRLSRRMRFSGRGRRLDLRRVIHRNIQHGGMPFDLVYRRPRPKPYKLVVLLDVSGSMNPYSTVFMRFVHGIIGNFKDAEAFVFHTRLIHISSAMRDMRPKMAMERLAVMAAGWSGGTRIGDCLATFNRNYAPRMLGSRTVVMILSDGFDTGAPEIIGRELAAIKRRAKRLVWLNPLAGWRGYEPTASGMAAALPHIDLFAPAHNLKSLMALEPFLAKL